MRKTFKHLPALLATLALSATLAACSDKDSYSINEARIDGNVSALSQLEAYSCTTDFNLVTDKDAEWTATVEWDVEEFNQPAYVYPKSGMGPTTLHIVSLDNTSGVDRTATLKITFPKDESKNISLPITQKHVINDGGNNEEYDAFQEAGAKARGIGYGYNAYAGYCDVRTATLPIFEVDRMFTEKAITFDYSTVNISQVEESGASAEELGRKLNASLHLEAQAWGASAAVDASFDIAHKQNESNEFAWMDINVETCNASLNVPMDSLISEYMTEGAMHDIYGDSVYNGRRGKKIVRYPSTPNGFLRLVRDYGTHAVVGGVLGGRLHTQVTCNTTNMTTAFDAKASLEVTYGGTFLSDLDAKVKAQMSKAQASNHTAFYYKASVRGGGQADGTKNALQEVLDLMSKARQGLVSTASYSYDDNMDVSIPDYSGDYEKKAKEWKEGLMLNGNSMSEMQEWLDHLALIDFNKKEQLVPLYELVSEETDPERRAAFEDWYKNTLMNDPTILTGTPQTYISTPPTIIGEDVLETMEDASTSQSLIRDIYLSDGNHVARVCSEFIPALNPSKRVNVIYPMVNGVPRYNLGIYLGGPASYPHYVSWGQYDDPSTPIITPISDTEVGGYKQVYLRGNHLTVFPDENIKENKYLKTKSKEYTLQHSDNGKSIVYPLVKINNYIYTRNFFNGRTYQNGAPQMSDNLWKEGGDINAFSPYWRNDDGDIDWYLVNNYTYNLYAWGGFAPNGWTVPYASQYKKMLENLTNITGDKPDGTIGASFLKKGVYGFNTKATGCIIVGYNSRESTKAERVAVVNQNILYLGAINDEDKEKFDGKTTVYTKLGELKTGSSCDALSIETSTGNAAMIHYNDQAPVLIDCTQMKEQGYYPENLRNKGEWNNYANRGNPIQYVKSLSYPSGWICYPIIICQKAFKF